MPRANFLIANKITIVGNNSIAKIDRIDGVAEEIGRREIINSLIMTDAKIMSQILLRMIKGNKIKDRKDFKDKRDQKGNKDIKIKEEKKGVKEEEEGADTITIETKNIREGKDIREEMIEGKAEKENGRESKDNKTSKDNLMSKLDSKTEQNK